jgi:hypothetical protein
MSALCQKAGTPVIPPLNELGAKPLMRGHVARMLGFTVGVHRVLSAANELPAVPLDELGLVESQLDGPRPGVD